MRLYVAKMMQLGDVCYGSWLLSDIDQLANVVAEIQRSYVLDFEPLSEDAHALLLCDGTLRVASNEEAFYIELYVIDMVALSEGPVTIP